MKIFITGIAGFLGSHLADQMIALGHTVAGNDTLIGGYVNNIPKQATDKILEQPIELNKYNNNNESSRIKHIEIIENKPIVSQPQQLQQNVSNSVNVSNNKVNDDRKVSSLFDMIKNTSLKDIINDNDIFLSNNKFLIDAKQKREQIIQQINNQPIIQSNDKKSVVNFQ